MREGRGGRTGRTARPEDRTARDTDAAKAAVIAVVVPMVIVGIAVRMVTGVTARTGIVGTEGPRTASAMAVPEATGTSAAPVAPEVVVSHARTASAEIATIVDRTAGGTIADPPVIVEAVDTTVIAAIAAATGLRAAAHEGTPGLNVARDTGAGTIAAAASRTTGREATPDIEGTTTRPPATSVAPSGSLSPRLTRLLLRACSTAVHVVPCGH